MKHQFFIFFILVAALLRAQDTTDISKQHFRLRASFHIGGALQSTLTYAGVFKDGVLLAPTGFAYDYEKNIQKWNLSPEIRLYAHHLNIGVIYDPNISYGYVHEKFGSNGNIIGTKNELMIDQHIGIYRYFPIWNAKHRKYNCYGGIGYGAYNVGKSFYSPAPWIFVGTLDLSFKAYSIFYGIPFGKQGKWNMEGRVSVIPQGFFLAPYNSFMFFGLKANYNILQHTWK